MARMQGMVSMYAVGIGAVLLFTLAGCRSSGCGGGCCGHSRANDCTAAPASLGAQRGATVATLPETATPRPNAQTYGGQKTCPVTGDELGPMGPPIPVAVKGDKVVPPRCSATPTPTWPRYDRNAPDPEP